MRLKSHFQRTSFVILVVACELELGAISSGFLLRQAQSPPYFDGYAASDYNSNDTWHRTRMEGRGFRVHEEILRKVLLTSEDFRPPNESKCRCRPSRSATRDSIAQIGQPIWGLPLTRLCCRP